MIEIKSNADKDAVAAACREFGLPPCSMLEMTQSGELLGKAFYEIRGERVIVHYLQAPDMPLTDALLRAALNAARSGGARIAQIVYEPLLHHMRSKGYFSHYGLQTVEISDFFAKSACKD